MFTYKGLRFSPGSDGSVTVFIQDAVTENSPVVREVIFDAETWDRVQEETRGVSHRSIPVAEEPVAEEPAAEEPVVEESEDEEPPAPTGRRGRR